MVRRRYTDEQVDDMLSEMKWRNNPNRWTGAHAIEGVLTFTSTLAPNCKQCGECIQPGTEFSSTAKFGSLAHEEATCQKCRPIVRKSKAGAA